MSVETEMEAQLPPNAAAEGRPDSGFETEAASPQKQRRINPMIAGAIVVVLLAIGIGWYIYAQGYEDTDDAQVDGHLNPIASRIDGTITAVRVDDNQAVQTGQLLVELIPMTIGSPSSKRRRSMTRPRRSCMLRIPTCQSRASAIKTISPHSRLKW